jgi:tRNA(His) guanylyltransferase
MRALEVFHSLRLPPGARVILRLDGRSFSRFTETHFDKPFDSRFHDRTAQAVLEDRQGLYAYAERNEISVVLPRTWNLFGRELEKSVPLPAGWSAQRSSLACGTRIQFDRRAVLATEDEQVVDYARWRQVDAARCALNGWTYWTLRNGPSPTRHPRWKARVRSTRTNCSSGPESTSTSCRAAKDAGPVCIGRASGGKAINPKLGLTVFATRRRAKVDRKPMGRSTRSSSAACCGRKLSSRQSERTRADALPCATAGGRARTTSSCDR